MNMYELASVTAKLMVFNTFQYYDLLRLDSLKLLPYMLALASCVVGWELPTASTARGDDRNW